MPPLLARIALARPSSWFLLNSEFVLYQKNSFFLISIILLLLLWNKYGDNFEHEKKIPTNLPYQLKLLRAATVYILLKPKFVILLAMQDILRVIMTPAELKIQPNK
jgi:hypothetical protein